MEEMAGRAAEMVASGGAWAPVLAFAFTAAVAVLPVPAEVPAALNGVLFGAVAGSAVTWTGAVAGAWISFEAARRWGRPLVERVLPAGRAERARALVTGRSAGPGLLGLRLVPVVAFTLLNWGAGLAGVRRSTFLWTTAVGIVPGVVLFTGGAGAAADALTGGMPPAWLFVAVGASAGAAVAALWRIRRR